MTGDYIVAQYEQTENHTAALEGWTILAALVMFARERDALDVEAYASILSLITTGFDRTARHFAKEVLAEPNFISPRFTIAEEPEVRGARTMLLLGWLTALAHRARQRGDDGVPWQDVRRIVLREMKNIRAMTEADWPYFMSLVLFVERDGTSTAGEVWLNRWMEAVLVSNRNDDSSGFPSPYWLQEKALARRFDKLPPDELESFHQHTYTVHSTLDMFVRRLCRQTVSGYWKRVSKFTLCDFNPDQACDWFRWRCEKGESRMALFPVSMSWAQWRGETATIARSLIPATLLEKPEWMLPFALVFPHRVNRKLSAAIDAVVGDRATLE